MIDEKGFIKCGGHRVSLRRLSETGELSDRQCSDVMIQNYTEMSLLTPPLVDVDGDTIRITEAGRHALSGYQVGESPAEREARRMTKLQALTLPAAARYRLRELKLQNSGVVPAGRVMWCRGRKVLGYCDVADIGKPHRIPDGADSGHFSASDYAAVMEQIA